MIESRALIPVLPGVSCAAIDDSGLKFREDAKRVRSLPGDRYTLAERSVIAPARSWRKRGSRHRGTLAEPGLPSSRNDDRYVMTGVLREFTWSPGVGDLFLIGMDRVHQTANERMWSGLLLMRKYPLPIPRNHRAIRLVEKGGTTTAME